MGLTLASLAPIRIKFSEIPGAHHNEVFQLPLPANLESALFDLVVRQ
jgi:hypothetical protein